MSRKDDDREVVRVRVEEDRSIFHTHKATVTLSDGTTATATGIGEANTIENASDKAFRR